MKKLLLIVLFILLPVWAMGATYYVNQSTGNDANAGSLAAPWKNTEYALQMLSAGDVLNITSPATSPDRGAFTTTVAGSLGSEITLQGTSSTPAYLASSRNVSHGATIGSLATPGNLIKNGNMDGWLSASSLWGIVAGASTHAKETGIVRSGASMKIVRNGSSLYYSWDIPNLPAGTEYTLSYWHYEAQADVRLKYTIIERDPAPDNYLQADESSWNSSGYVFDPNDNSNGAWRQTTKTFTTNGAGTYRITISATNNGTYYLDDLSLVPTTPTYAWVVHAGDVYKLTGYLDTTRMFAKCTNARWTSGGLESLEYVPKAGSLATMAPGEWWFESGVLYYYLATGETIDSLHIEAGTGSGINAIDLAHDYYALSNINQYGGNNHGINLTGDNVTLDNVGVFFNYSCGLFNEGAYNVANHCEGAYTYNEDIFEIASGDLTCNRCIAHHAFDDGFFAILTGTLNTNYCVSYNNGLENASDNSGFGVESSSAVIVLKNCTSAYNYGRGIQIGGNSSYTVTNCISHGSVADNSMWVKDATEQAKGTHTYNLFDDKNAAWTAGATESVADPLFRSVTDFRLKSGSPAINAGTDVGLTTDFLGKPIRGLPDIGAYEFQSVGGGLGMGIIYGF